MLDFIQINIIRPLLRQEIRKQERKIKKIKPFPGQDINEVQILIEKMKARFEVTKKTYEALQEPARITRRIHRGKDT